MGNMNRRNFIRNTAILAAGTAVTGVTSAGLVARENYRERPVDIKMYFFHPDPVVIKGTLFVDEAKGIFGMRAGEGRGYAEMTATYYLVKDIVDSGRTKYIYSRIVFDRQEEIKVLEMSIASGKFMVQEYGKPPAPFWTQLEDVRRIVS